TQSRRSQQPRHQQSISGGGGNGGQGRIRRAASTAVGSVKEHPVAAVAIGASVAALVFTGVKALASGRQKGERGKSRGASDRAERDDDEDADAFNDGASTDEDDDESQAGTGLGHSLQEVQSIW